METFKGASMNVMGKAPGLSQADRRVQILALQLGNRVTFVRCVSKSQYPHLSGGVKVHSRPTLGFVKM